MKKYKDWKVTTKVTALIGLAVFLNALITFKFNINYITIFNCLLNTLPLVIFPSHFFSPYVQYLSLV